MRCIHFSYAPTHLRLRARSFFQVSRETFSSFLCLSNFLLFIIAAWSGKKFIFLLFCSRKRIMNWEDYKLLTSATANFWNRSIFFLQWIADCLAHCKHVCWWFKFHIRSTSANIRTMILIWRFVMMATTTLFSFEDFHIRNDAKIYGICYQFDFIIRHMRTELN